MFLSRYQLFQVVVLVNIASHTAAKAHLSTWYLDSQYRLLNIISCGIFLLYSPWRVWHVQTTVEFLTVCLSFTSHTEAGEARQGSPRILFKKYWPKKKKVQFSTELGYFSLTVLSPLFALKTALCCSLNVTLVKVNISINPLDNSYKFTNWQITRSSFSMALSLILRNTNW